MKDTERLIKTANINTTRAYKEPTPNTGIRKKACRMHKYKTERHLVN